MMRTTLRRDRSVTVGLGQFCCSQLRVISTYARWVESKVVSTTHRVSTHVVLLESFNACQRSRSVPTKRSSRRRLQAQRTKNTQTAAAAAMTTASSGLTGRRSNIPDRGGTTAIASSPSSRTIASHVGRRSPLGSSLPAQNRLGGSTNITKSRP